MTIAVALIPDSDTVAAARFLNGRYLAAGSKISLTPTPEARNLPHLSLIHAAIEDDEATTLLQRIIKKVHGYKRVPTAMMQRTTLRFGEWIFWDAEPDSPVFASLLEAVLEATNEVRGDRRVDVSWTLNPQQQEAHDRYGYPNTGPALEPHITLGLIPKDLMPEELKRPTRRFHKAFFGKLVVARTGPFGTIARILAEHNL